MKYVNYLIIKLQYNYYQTYNYYNYYDSYYIIISMINYNDELLFSSKVKKCLSFDPFLNPNIQTKQKTSTLEEKTHNNDLKLINKDNNFKINQQQLQKVIL